MFFFRKTPKWGGRGLAESEISLSEKTEIFLEKGGGAHLFQKGFIIKDWGFWAIFAKKGGHIDFIKKKLRIFRIFSPKGGEVWPIPKFPYQKKLGHSELLRGGGQG